MKKLRDITVTAMVRMTKEFAVPVDWDDERISDFVYVQVEDDCTDSVFGWDTNQVTADWEFE